MRLIDADDRRLRAELWTYTRDTGIDEAPFENAIKAIDNAPTIDAVEVVRCKDCVYARKINTHSNGRRNYKCYKYSMFNNAGGRTITYEVLVDDNHYCAYGEREEE